MIIISLIRDAVTFYLAKRFSRRSLERTIHWGGEGAGGGKERRVEIQHRGNHAYIFSFLWAANVGFLFRRRSFRHSGGDRSSMLDISLFLSLGDSTTERHAGTLSRHALRERLSVWRETRVTAT